MTSPPQTIQISCPQCGTKYEDWYRSINCTLDDFDDDYVREATTAACPACGTVVTLDVLTVRRDGVWEIG